MDVEDVRPPDVLAHLADRLEERQALDVADGPADLDDDDVGVAVAGDALDPLLDLVRDVGDDLDRAAEVVAAALLGDDRLVDAAGRHVGELGEVLVDEPLVVAQVEVRLGAVVGDEDLAVLVGRHRPRVDVDVRVELEDGDGEAAGLEEPADAGGGDAFAERGGHASGHKDILRHGSGPPGVFPMLPDPGLGASGRDGRRVAHGSDAPADRDQVLPTSGGARAMEFHDVVMKRRAVRRFEEGGVERGRDRGDRPARPADAVGRLQPGPAARRGDGPGGPPAGRPDLRRGGVRGPRDGAVDLRVRRPVRPVRLRGDLPPPLPGARQGRRGRPRDRVAGPLLVGRHRGDDDGRSCWPPSTPGSPRGFAGAFDPAALRAELGDPRRVRARSA